MKFNEKTTELIYQLRRIQDSSGLDLVKPNIFLAAGLLQQEIRHSSILAFLLKPYEWHGLGDLFLRRVLSMASADRTDALDIALSRLDDVRVFNEVPVFEDGKKNHGRLDIVAYSEKEAILLVIENKIGAQQGQQQLEKYNKWTASKYGEKCKRVLVYLTLGEEDPDDTNWFPITYADIINQLEEILDMKSHSLGEYAKIYIENYIDLVRRFIMKENNNSIMDIAKILWKDYGEILDKINEYRPTPFVDAAGDFIKNNDLVKIALGNNNLHFITKEMSDLSLENTKMERSFWGWGRNSTPVHFIIEMIERNSKYFLRLSVFVGPATQNIRQKIISALATQNAINPSGRAREDANRFTRIWGYETKDLGLDEEKDSDAILSAMNELFKKYKSHDELIKALRCIIPVKDSEN